MADIYLLGHGSWDTRGKASAYTIVPKDTSVVFYTPVGRFISSRQTSAILRGDPGHVKPEIEYKAFGSCPNIELSDGLFAEEEKAVLTSGKRFVRVAVDTPISELLQKYAGNRLHWLACAPRLGGKDTTEGGFNEDYFPDNGVGVIRMARNPDTIRGR
jgi:hypothetical protein